MTRRRSSSPNEFTSTKLACFSRCRPPAMTSGPARNKKRNSRIEGKQERSPEPPHFPFLRRTFALAFTSTGSGRPPWSCRGAARCALFAAHVCFLGVGLGPLPALRQNAFGLAASAVSAAGTPRRRESRKLRPTAHTAISIRFVRRGAARRAPSGQDHAYCPDARRAFH